MMKGFLFNLSIIIMVNLCCGSFFKDYDGLIGGIISTVVSAAVLIIITRRQNRFLRKQQFESTFFNLLGNLEQIVNNTEGDIVSNTDLDTHSDNIFTVINEPSISYSGRQFYSAANETLQSFINAYMNALVVDEPDTVKSFNKEVILNTVQEAYIDFFNKHNSQLGHYFRYLYSIAKFVTREDSLKQHEKEYYLKFIQAQMSSDELCLLFFNGISENGKNFFYIIEEYNFLQNMVFGDIKHEIVRKIAPYFYPKSYHMFREVINRKNNNF